DGRFDRLCRVMIECGLTIPWAEIGLETPKAARSVYTCSACGLTFPESAISRHSAATAPAPGPVCARASGELYCAIQMQVGGVLRVTFTHGPETVTAMFHARGKTDPQNHTNLQAPDRPDDEIRAARIASCATAAAGRITGGKK